MKLICKKETPYGIETFSIKEVIEEVEEFHEYDKEKYSLIEVTDKFLDVARVDMGSNLIEDYYIRLQHAYIGKREDEWCLLIFNDSQEALSYFDEDDTTYDYTDLFVQVIKSFEELEGYTKIAFEKCSSSKEDLAVELLCLYYRFLNLKIECFEQGREDVTKAIGHFGFNYTNYHSMLKGYLAI